MVEDRILVAKIMVAIGTIMDNIRNLEVDSKELLKEWLVTRGTTTNTNNRVAHITTKLMAKKELITVISRTTTLLNSTTT